MHSSNHRHPPRIYRGSRYKNETLVTVNGNLLHPHESFPVGFDWGFSGVESAHLAYAILANCYNPRIAFKQHQRFKKDVIAEISSDIWMMTQKDISDWLNFYREGEKHESIT